MNVKFHAIIRFIIFIIVVVASCEESKKTCKTCTFEATGVSRIYCDDELEEAEALPGVVCK
jgi:hypothetical protein